MSNTILELHRLLSVDVVRVRLPGDDKQTVIENTIELLRNAPAVDDLEELRQSVLEREAIMSTGVGKGLALPHAKTNAVQRTIAAFAVTEKEIDFGSIDNKSVRLIFLLVGPESAKSQHIKILSRVSRLMNRDTFRERLLTANSPAQIVEAFREGEEEFLES